MEKGLISVITLAYNSMETIFETIDSILSQDYPNIEIIISDDCSKYFDVEKIKKYIEDNKGNNIQRYKINRNSQNLGTVKNINNAIKMSNGEYIVNLSSGDLLYSRETLSQIHEEFITTGCMLLCTRRAFFVENKNNVTQYMPSDREIKCIELFVDPKAEYEAFYSGFMYHMASGSAFSYRRDYIEKMGYYDERYRLWEDGPFFVKSIKMNGLLHHNYSMTTIYYRFGGVSTGSMPNDLRNDSLLFLNDGLIDPDISQHTKRHIKYRISKIELSNLNPMIMKLVLFLRFPLICLERYLKNKKGGTN